MTTVNPGEVRQGIGVSPGTAYGPVVQVAPRCARPAAEPAPADRDATAAAVAEAFAAVAAALDAKAQHVDDTAQTILKATAMIARDKSLLKSAVAGVHAGIGPATAIAAAVEEFAIKFEALGGYFAERGADLRDVGSRAGAAGLTGPPNRRARARWEGVEGRPK